MIINQIMALNFYISSHMYNCICNCSYLLIFIKYLLCNIHMYFIYDSQSLQKIIIYFKIITNREQHNA